MKVLYFDLEHGSQSLGSKKDVQELFGYPTLEPGTWNQFQSTVGKLYKEETTSVEIPIGDTTISEERTSVVPRNGTVIHGIILDTFSELSKKYMRSISDKDGKMRIQGWGQLKNKLDAALEFVSRVPGLVICNCHSKVQTMDECNKIIPYIDGSTKEDISKWFDFVFYTKTVLKKDGTRDYVWITKRCEIYDHAKDRTNLLPAQIPQDYQLVLEAANTKGFDGIKILVIGAPGSGKTLSLKTLKQGGSNENTND